MLPPPSRRLLAYVASTGERCWEGLAIHLANGQLAGGDGRAALDALVEAGLLTEEGASSLPGEVEYRFQSELLRSAAERLTPYGDRGALHRRVALWLEQRAPLELSKLIGHHFEKAGMLEAAYPHYLAAADSAVTAHNLDAAFEIFEHLLALDLAPHAPGARRARLRAGGAGGGRPEARARPIGRGQRRTRAPPRNGRRAKKRLRKAPRGKSRGLLTPT